MRGRSETRGTHERPRDAPVRDRPPPRGLISMEPAPAAQRKHRKARRARGNKPGVRPRICALHPRRGHSSGFASARPRCARLGPESGSAPADCGLSVSMMGAPGRPLRTTLSFTHTHLAAPRTFRDWRQAAGTTARPTAGTASAYGGTHNTSSTGLSAGRPLYVIFVTLVNIYATVF